MHNTQDKFWKLFFSGFAIVLGVSAVICTAFFIQSPLSTENVAAVAGTDPFATQQIESPPKLPSTPQPAILYQDGLASNLYIISWNSIAKWQPLEPGDTYTIRTVVEQAWGGFGIGGIEPSSLSTATSFTFDLLLDSDMSEIYLELYNSHEGTVGRVALTSYTTLTQNEWHTITVPLSDFGTNLPHNLVGLGWVVAEPGTLSINNVRLLP